MKKLWTLLLSLVLFSASFAQADGVAITPPPSLILKNRFGEQSYNYVMGGSNQVDINFIVDSTNGNGFGVRSLKGSGAHRVYMHTSATPAAGNPNPAVGYILIQLASNYAGYIGGYSGFVSPVSGTPINVTTGVTAGLAYIITSLGTTPASGFTTLGLPAGITPAVGASFIAPANAVATGTGTIEVPAAAGAGPGQTFDVIGDPNLEVGATSGAFILVRCLGATNSSTTTLQATAPVDGSTVGMRFVLTALPNSLK